MKILKLAQEQEFIHEDNFEINHALQQEQKFKQYHTADIISKITPLFLKRLDTSFIVNGTKGLFLYEDDQVYEITITPSNKNKFFNNEEQKLENDGIKIDDIKI
jgi:hypothetical protein